MHNHMRSIKKLVGKRMTDSLQAGGGCIDLVEVHFSDSSSFFCHAKLATLSLKLCMEDSMNSGSLSQSSPPLASPTTYTLASHLHTETTRALPCLAQIVDIVNCKASQPTMTMKLSSVCHSHLLFSTPRPQYLSGPNSSINN